MICGVVCRLSSDPELLWLWRRPVATAPIRPIAWEPPYAVGTALEKAKRQKKPKTNKQKNLMLTKKEKWERNKLGVWDKQIHITMYKIGPTV